ncbi:PQQ-binding-like beta-propeller repeat protein [Streptomyces subrutilus]|uniref:outer membrane protein assembly factor BamB family protein n=1 Tax=Streptomyces subrutilus TaxID=36818 RepID=UPI0033EE6C70
MSTPPPPSQPPSGGFGAPQDPPPGGFGAPVPPPAPQQPPAPPEQPPADQPAAYGYPQQPAYGYPQQPGPAGTPPPFGQPPTVPQSFPAAAPAGGNEVRTQLLIVGAALLAIVLIIGGGFWYTSGDGTDAGGGGRNTADGKEPGGDKPQAGPAGSEKVPANTKSKPLFNQPNPQPAEVVSVAGSWLTDTTYVKSDVAKVVGYNTVDGGKKWELPFPGELCGATRHVSDNKTAVLFKPSLPTAETKYPQCSEVGVIDLTTGKLVWSGNAKSATSGDKPVAYNEVTISGRTVAAAGVSGGAAWNLADGASLWLPKVDGEGCRDTGYAGGEALAVIRKCGQSSDYTLHAQLLDPATGAPTVSYKLAPGIEYAGIVSTKPLVVGADVGKTAKNATGLSDLFVVGPSGELKARISLADGTFAGKCAATEVEKCSNMVVGNGKLYLPSYEHQGGSSAVSRTNELLSFDLETGKQTTDRADAGEGHTIFPLRMDGSNIIAYKRPPYDKGGQVVSIDGTTMKETVLMVNPADKASQRIETAFSPEYSEYRYHDGKLFISRTTARKPYSDKSDPEYLFVSFTAS